MKTNSERAGDNPEDTVAETRMRRHIHRLKTSKSGEMVLFFYQGGKQQVSLKKGRIQNIWEKSQVEDI